MKNWRLTTPAALVIAAALLVAGVLIAVFSEQSYGRQKVRETTVQAEILASIETAALSFEKKTDAVEYLNALKQNAEIRDAAVYDASGDLFASFSASPDWTPPDHVDDIVPHIEHGHVLVDAPVVLQDKKIGSVLVRSITEPVTARLARYSGIILLFAMAALLVTILARANNVLAGANRKLEERARLLAESNDELSREIAERQNAEAALRQAQKMETIGQLTGGVAHDFNNLLTIVLGNLERMQRQISKGDLGGDAMKSSVENAIRGAERAANLTRQLLAFARRQPLKPSPVDVNKLVSNTSELLRRALGEKITIETVVGAGLWRVSADPNQLENAILNLAVNSRDAMQEGGKLTIETANSFLDENYARAHDDVTTGQYVMLAITDTGAGMAPDVIERVFEPFFTTKEAGYGTGLGLSQVYGFVKQSGGHIKVYSEVGEGTTIKIYLPRLFGEAAVPDPEPVSADAPRGDSKTTVLVVEDDESVRMHTVRLVEELGYTAVAAPSGAAALRALEKNPHVDILFTDVGLPDGMNGRQLAEAAHKMKPDLKVLYTTGYARNAIVHDGRLDPGVHLVTKPFTFAAVGAALARALGEGGGTVRTAVLLVEDEALIRMNAAKDLEELGFIVFEAGSAEAAMRIAKEAKNRLAAVIVDIGLPDIKGDELAVSLRALDADLVIVLASGYAEGDVRERFADDARVRFLSKPYMSGDLRSVLAAAGIVAKGTGSEK